MQRFKELLEAPVAHSTFDLGHTEMRHGDVVTSFALNSEELVSPQRFRELLLETKWNAEGGNRPRRAKLICPDELLSQLEGHLRFLLDEYVDPDTNLIGYALPHVVTGGFGCDNIPSEWNDQRLLGITARCIRPGLGQSVRGFGH